MFNGLFSKNESDLDGPAFKKQFQDSKNAMLIDVRTPEEYALGTIPGAINLDVMSSDFQTKIQTLNPDKTYFMFCRSGNRSGNAVKSLKKLGLQSYNLVGGLNSWPKQ